MIYLKINEGGIVDEIANCLEGDGFSVDREEDGTCTITDEDWDIYLNPQDNIIAVTYKDSYFEFQDEGLFWLIYQYILEAEATDE